jgi:transcriptional regulator with XRE-family HTH domain
MIGERIERARLAAGLSLRALADAIGVSHTMVSKYEKNETTPSSQLLIGIAKALGVRVEYFFRKAEIHLDGVEYRKRTTLTAGDRKKILADAEDQLERWAALEQFIPQAWSVGFDIPATVPERVAHDEDIETAALALREAWKLGHNPIPDLIDTLEEHGLRVVTVAGDTKQKFDGFSARCGTMPVVVVGKGWVGDRQRFTLAHELGHLVLQGRLASGLVEEKACFPCSPGRGHQHPRRTSPLARDPGTRTPEGGVRDEHAGLDPPLRGPRDPAGIDDPGAVAAVPYQPVASARTGPPLPPGRDPPVQAARLPGPCRGYDR